MPPTVQGLYPDVVVPLGADRRIMERELIMYVQHLARVGVVVGGVVIDGAFGEGAALRDGERARLIERARVAAPKDLDVLAGVRATTAEEATALTTGARDAGAGGAVLYTAGVDDPEAFALAVADAGTLPLVVHLPAATPLYAEAVGRIAAHPGVVAIATATTDPDAFTAQQAAARPEATCLSAAESPDVLERLAGDCDGVLGGAINVGTALWAAVVRAARADRTAEAHELLGRLGPVVAALAPGGDDAANPRGRALVKEGLVQLGLFSTAEVRGDGIPPDDADRASIRTALVGAGLLPG
jgi:4-hydroxy-tetrahydrodipicolinate synthase